MPGPVPQPVSPPTFHLRIRLTDLSGNMEPFLGRDYEIEWAGRRVVWDKTVPADGVVIAALVGEPKEGVLTLGEKTGDGTFVPRLKIPLKAISVHTKPEVASLPTKAEMDELTKYYAYAWAWRLSNLGHLSGLWCLDWPVDGTTLLRGWDALRRYARKHDILSLSDALVDDPSGTVTLIRDLLQSEHDGQ